jgi:hypothetical protein
VRRLAMMLRYAHLSPAHRLDAVQRLNSGTQDPVILVDGEWFDLPALVQNRDGFLIGDASAMNQHGDMVGSETTAMGEVRGFVLEVTQH